MQEWTLAAERESEKRGIKDLHGEINIAPEDTETCRRREREALPVTSVTSPGGINTAPEDTDRVGERGFTGNLPNLAGVNRDGRNATSRIYTAESQA
jgi:hypothetical protein